MTVRETDKNENEFVGPSTVHTDTTWNLRHDNEVKNSMTLFTTQRASQKAKTLLENKQKGNDEEVEREHNGKQSFCSVSHNAGITRK